MAILLWGDRIPRMNGPRIVGVLDTTMPGANCIGPFASSGYNLLGNADGCEFNSAGSDLVGSFMGTGVIDPLLGPLAKNGGPTQTMSLATSSAAVNRIPLGPPLCTVKGKDQRGVARPQGLACDVGAFELVTSG